MHTSYISVNTVQPEQFSLLLTFTYRFIATLCQNHNEEQFNAEQCALKIVHFTYSEKLGFLRIRTVAMVLKFLTCL